MNPSLRKRAFALVLVLITLLLITSMTIVFLVSVGGERRGVDVYGRGSEVRHLARMAVNLVIGEISAATKEGTAGSPVSWASQPGMVRTYASDGSAKSIYKLYSWDSLVEPGTGFNPFAATEVPPADWKTYPEVFTDLNQVVNDVYPIVDPRASGVVQGFSIDKSNPVVTNGGSDAPMPVKWLYILEDGQMVPPSNVSGSTATIAGAAADNRVVGRIAFWTDDETAKVNVNTASEGAYWDMPKSGSRDDVQFAGNPPVRGEFQRVPGHPAMTSLSAVFPELLTTDRWSDITTYRKQLDDIYTLAPRIQGGGSLGGTFPIASYQFDYEPTYNSVTLPTPITMDAERLFATADEFWFRPDRTEAPALKSDLANGVDDFRKRLFFVTANSRAPETTLFETPRVSLWPITWPWPSSYFTKRAGAPSAIDPNTTPVSSNPWMVAEERLLAFCSTINTSGTNESVRHRYYFQRQNPDSPTHDWANITRNRDLVSYLSRELNQKVPGWGASVASKWNTTTADAMALSCFDYCRSLINQYTLDPSGSGLAYSYTGVTFRKAIFKSVSINDYKEPNAFTVAPLRVSLSGTTHVTQGAYPALNEVALMFYATQRQEPIPPANKADLQNPYKWRNLINSGGSPTKAPYGNDQYDNGTPGDTSDDTGSRTTEMKAVMIFDFSKMKPGVLNYTPVFWIKVKGGSFQVNGNSIGLPDSSGRSIRWDTRIGGGVPLPFAPMYVFDPAAASQDYTTVKTFSNTATGCNVWTLISNPITVNPNALTFGFSGSNITVEIYAPYSSNLDTDPTGDPNQLVSQKTIDFGSWSGSALPIPLAPRWTTCDGVTNTIDASTGGATPAGINFKPNPASPNPTKVPSGYTAETRDTKWAFAEFAPLVTQFVNDPTIDPRDRAGDDNKSSSVPICYAYRGRLAGSSVMVSPDIANRVLSLAQKNGAGVAFSAEVASINLFSGSSFDFFEEAWSMITPYDTVISMVDDPNAASAGDSRLVESAPFVRIDTIPGIGTPAEVFRSAPSGTLRYFPRLTARAQKHQLGTPGRIPMTTGYRKFPTLGGNFVARYGRVTSGPGNLGDGDSTGGIVGAEFGALALLPTGDWTAMPGNAADGAYVARPDQEFQSLSLDSDKNRTFLPYFLKYDNYEASMANYFSPNREVPSPVILGTLPSSDSVGWQTLAFSPNPASASHPGLKSPPDHLLLDLFWMPVAEPYPMSDQFSTAGKINLNYAIAPFSYIQRKTGLHALMKATWMTVQPDAAAMDYKSHYFMRNDGTHTRFPIDIPETLGGFDQKFSGGDLFRSASQLCEMFLVPQGESLASVKGAFWNNKHLTGDNAREEPYDHLYSRVTTKSNTYTVHWRVQVLRKPSGQPDQWDETKKKVVADLRGSTLIERYINPNATDIPDYATDPTAAPLSGYYKWRVISESFFQP